METLKSKQRQLQLNFKKRPPNMVLYQSIFLKFLSKFLSIWITLYFKVSYTLGQNLNKQKFKCSIHTNMLRLGYLPFHYIYPQSYLWTQYTSCLILSDRTGRPDPAGQKKKLYKIFINNCLKNNFPSGDCLYTIF